MLNFEFLTIKRRQQHWPTATHYKTSQTFSQVQERWPLNLLWTEKKQHDIQMNLQCKLLSSKGQGDTYMDLRRRERPTQKHDHSRTESTKPAGYMRRTKQRFTVITHSAIRASI